jgi:triosephosphate isomerase
MRQKVVAGNWKMHGSIAEIRTLLDAIVPSLAELSGVRCVVCVPFPYLAQVQGRLTGTNLFWGAQNLNASPQGAYTGEVSAAMLLDFGCRYVIVGHSERRTLLGEHDALIAAKTQAALNAGLVPIVCVGETLAQRESGQTSGVVRAQLDVVLNVVGPQGLSRSVVAYEPVWAIGTGKTATPDEAQAVHAQIRADVARRDAAVAKDVSIVYGGSVKAANAAELFAMPDIDGGLVGGASLVAKEFVGICRAVRA